MSQHNFWKQKTCKLVFCFLECFHIHVFSWAAGRAPGQLVVLENHLLLFSWQMSFFFLSASLHRISEYMDLTPAEVVGHTCYHFIYVEDLENIRQSHEDCESSKGTRSWPKSSPFPLYLYSILIWRVWWSLTLSCCDRRPLLPQLWTARLIAGLIFLFLPVSAEERSGGHRLLSLASEERRLPVDPVHCHGLHQPQSSSRTKRHLG